MQDYKTKKERIKSTQRENLRYQLVKKIITSNKEA